MALTGPEFDPSVKPTFVDTVTHVPAWWANDVTDLIFTIFDRSKTKAQARTALGLGTLAVQNADTVNIEGGEINNTRIGEITPQQGTFSVLTVMRDPIDPLHVVTKRYLHNSLGGYADLFLPYTGGVMTGPLTLDGDPVNALDAVPKRWVLENLKDVVKDTKLQRWYTVSTGQSTFKWVGFQSPHELFAENFLVWVDGIYQTLDINYTITLTGEPIFDFETPVEAGREFDICYVDNARNLLLELAEATDATGFSATAAWANPVNTRYNYDIANAGAFSISSTHAIITEMSIGCKVLTGLIGSKVVTFSTKWIPLNADAIGNGPSIIHVSGTEIKLQVPRNPTDIYYEGTIEVGLLIDGMPYGYTLFAKFENQSTATYDGKVTWGKK